MLFSKDIFQRRQSTEWCILSKNAAVFFHGPPFHHNVERTSGRHFFLTLSEGLADSRMERINSRCEGAQGNSETLFCLSLLNIHEDKINICVWYTAQLLNRSNICILKWGSALLLYYHWQLWPKSNHCFNLHKVFKECYYSILDDLSTLHKQALVYCEHLVLILWICTFLKGLSCFWWQNHEKVFKILSKNTFLVQFCSEKGDADHVICCTGTEKLLHNSFCQHTIN